MSLHCPRLLGQFGNQLQTYLLCKILAERMFIDYRPPAEFVTKAGKPVQWSGVPLFKMLPTSGRKLETMPQFIDAVQWFDMDGLDHERPIILRAWFGQRYEFLKPWKGRIKHDWLRLGRPFLPVEDRDVYVHVRRTDYVDLGNGMGPPSQLHNGCATTIDEYRRCLAEFPGAAMVRIVTDDYSDPFVKQLGDALGLPWTAEPTPWDVDFMRLASARQLIICQSTFSWWAGWLGRAEKIVCPMFSGTFWANGMGLVGPPAPGELDFPNLVVDDEGDRWVWVT